MNLYHSLVKQDDPGVVKKIFIYFESLSSAKEELFSTEQVASLRTTIDASQVEVVTQPSKDLGQEPRLWQSTHELFHHLTCYCTFKKKNCCHREKLNKIKCRKNSHDSGM